MKRDDLSVPPAEAGREMETKPLTVVASVKLDKLSWAFVPSRLSTARYRRRY
jgi:hypothetical protein